MHAHLYARPELPHLHLCKAWVNHVVNAVDGKRRLRNVGGDHALALAGRRRLKDACLNLTGQRTARGARASSTRFMHIKCYLSSCIEFVQYWSIEIKCKRYICQFMRVCCLLSSTLYSREDARRREIKADGWAAAGEGGQETLYPSVLHVILYPSVQFHLSLTALTYLHEVWHTWAAYVESCTPRSWAVALWLSTR